MGNLLPNTSLEHGPGIEPADKISKQKGKKIEFRIDEIMGDAKIGAKHPCLLQFSQLLPRLRASSIISAGLGSACGIVTQKFDIYD
jgi:hypothetical protein